MNIKIKFLAETAIPPIKATDGAASYDLFVSRKEIDFENEITTYYTDVAFEIPKGFVGMLFSRSSIYKTGQSQCNAVGIIDSDYRGGVCLKTYNVAKDVNNPINYKVGERCGQIVIVPIPDVTYVISDVLSSTDRGEGGFGSTGK